jgi:hypothetical protein
MDFQWKRLHPPSVHGNHGHAGTIASLVEQGIPLEEAPSDFGHRRHAGMIVSLVAQGFSVEDAKFECSRRVGKECRGKGGENDIHGYYLVQEINKHGIPCNHQTDWKAGTWKDIAMWLASDNVRIGHTTRNLVSNFCLDGEIHKIINHKNMSDKRRWRVLWGHNIPHGIKSVNEAEIMKEIPKMKRKSAKKN